MDTDILIENKDCLYGKLCFVSHTFTPANINNVLTNFVRNKLLTLETYFVFARVLE